MGWAGIRDQGKAAAELPMEEQRGARIADYRASFAMRWFKNDELSKPRFLTYMKRALKYAGVLIIILGCYFLIAIGFDESALTHQKYMIKREFSEWEYAGKPRDAKLALYALDRKKQTTFNIEFGELVGFSGDSRVIIILNMGRNVVGIEGIGTFVEK